MPQTLVYVTTGSHIEAHTIAHDLVKNRLVACANIIAGTTSVFNWEGEVCEEQEVTLILKTRNNNVKRLVNKIKEMHSYDCPCIISLPISGGNLDFLEWIDTEALIKK